MVRESGKPMVEFSAQKPKKQNTEDRIYQGRIETNVENVLSPEMKVMGLKKEYLKVQLKNLLGDDVLVEGALTGMNSEDADLREKSKADIKALASDYAYLAKKYEADIREAAKPKPVAPPGERLTYEARKAAEEMRVAREAKPKELSDFERGHMLTSKTKLAEEMRAAREAKPKELSDFERGHMLTSKTKLAEEMRAAREASQTLTPKEKQERGEEAKDLYRANRLAADREQGIPALGQKTLVDQRASFKRQGVESIPMEMPEASERIEKMKTRDEIMDEIAAIQAVEREANQEQERLRAEKLAATTPMEMPEASETVMAMESRDDTMKRLAAEDNARGEMEAEREMNQEMEKIRAERLAAEAPVEDTPRIETTALEQTEEELADAAATAEEAKKIVG